MDIIGLIIIADLIVATVVLTLLYVELDIFGPLIGATVVLILLFVAWNLFSALVTATAVLALLTVAAALLIARILLNIGKGERPPPPPRPQPPTGIATTELAPTGMVQLVGGEEWSAVSDTGETIEKGAEVIVLYQDGLRLMVFKAEE